MRWFAAVIVGVAIVAKVGFWLSTRPEPATPMMSETAGSEVAVAPPQPPAPVAAETSRPQPEDNLMYRRPPPGLMEKIMTHEVALERYAEHDRQMRAAERFNQGLEEGQFEADDVDRSVIAMFKSVELEPVLDEDGLILGLEMRNIYPDSPLLGAGFRTGDRITVINDQPLRDPVDVPSALTHLDRNLSLCVDRAGTEICQRVELD